MPKGISRNPRTDMRRKKNRKPETTPALLDVGLEVGPVMTFQEAMNTVRDLTVRDLTAKEDADFREFGTLPKDTVNHPPHYTAGGIETIDFIEAKQLNYHLGQVVKYITRAEHKNNSLEDLQKAQWYLNREIENRSKT